ncbi:ATP-binding protein [Asanoa sp. NPDC050611]|uniref:sensor histidine kinase n=1 Tax=Asanoa sp. NPDC050611 TaxID=3157098 RepID=UPI0033EE9FD2
MDQSIIAAYAGVAAATGALVALFFTVAQYRIAARRSAEATSEMARMQRQLIREVGEEKNRPGVESRHGEMLLAEAIEGLPYRLGNALNDFSHRFASALRSSYEWTEGRDGTVVYNTAIYSAPTANEALSNAVREIAHSLNSPLLAIESAALTRIALEGKRSAEMQDIVDAVAVCKAFLQAYRNSTSDLAQTEEWSPGSLRSAVAAALKIYSQRLEKAIVADVALPDAIEGYSNNLLVAMLLPLVENAVESSPEPGTVVVRAGGTADHLSLSVVNQFSGDPPTTEIYQPEFTTKSNHSGLGLSIVSRMVGSYRGGEVRHKVEGDQIEFVIKLPLRQA